MRPKIHGWIVGLLLSLACVLAVSALVVKEGPAEERSGTTALAAGRPQESAPQVPPTSAWDNLAPRRVERVPDLISPPDSPGSDLPPGVSLDPHHTPASNPVASTAEGPKESNRPDNSAAVIQISFEKAEPTQDAEEETDVRNVPERRPVGQFVRQVSQSPTEQVPTARVQREPARPGQPPESAQVPSFVGQVEVQGLDQLGVIILRGNPQDVEAMKKIIEEIQKISEGIEPYVRVFQLQRASAVNVRETILELYSGSTSTTTGAARPAGGGQTTGQTAQSAATALQTPALRRFQIAADDRSNTLVVLASPQMMEELSRLIERLDVDGAPIVNELRVFQLKSAEATEVANILTQALTGQAATTTGQAVGGTAGTVAGGGPARLSDRSSVLRFVPLEGQSRMVQSGILDEVRVTAQIRTNSVIVSAPASSMPLMASIVAELDKPPSIVASMKVFELKNADATNMRLTLAELFDLEPTTTTGGLGGGVGGLGATTQFQRPVAVASGEQPPVSIRVAVDERTNSLVVSGPDSALLSVEAVVRKLDLSDIHNRKSTVYRLKNSYAIDVATALTQFFTNKRTIEGQAVGLTAQQGTIVGAFQRMEQDVVVVALDNSLAAQLSTAASITTTATPATQGVSNMLLISASPRYFDQVIKMIEEMDAPQPQVMIQCIVANLLVNDDFEFGIEFGLQNDVLFSRGGTPGSPDVPGSPGFNFNTTAPLGNTNAVHPAEVGNQGLSNLGLGRASLIDGVNGAGGLILAASSKNISSLIRALQANGKLEILTRPQIMTMDGRTARVQVGENFPYVGNVNITTTATIPTVSFLGIGVILTVKPSITPDNRIYLEIVPEISELRELVNVQTITTNTDTITIQAPRTTTTTANTAVSVSDGQTIVLGGLIQRRTLCLERKIPWLGDLPHLGFLFRYSQERELKQELIIIMTPHIIRSEADAQRVKDIEAARLSWIINDATAIHGDLGLTSDETTAGGESATPESSLPEIEPSVLRTMNAEEFIAPSGAPRDWAIPGETQMDTGDSLQGNTKPDGGKNRSSWFRNDRSATGKSRATPEQGSTRRRPNLLGTMTAPKPSQ